MLSSTEHALAEALPDAVIALTKDLQLSWWNNAAAKLFTLTNQHLGISITEIIDDTRFSDFLMQPTPANIELSAPSQPQIMLAFSLFPYIEQQHILIVKDITHTHLLENMRQDFIANVSHELRTPLTVLSGYIETLLSHEHDETKPWKKILQQMQSQSLRMEHLVQDLLLLSRLETDQPNNKNWQKTDISTLLQSICDDATALSGGKHQFHLHVDTKLTVRAQAHELRSAFSNIIFNAVNYTPAQGHIHVDWLLENQRPCLRVRDTGIGIEKKHLPRLTQRFYRVDKARSRANGGTGLGLAIVKHVLLRHNAELIINSVPGQGSTFICLFPSI